MVGYSFLGDSFIRNSTPVYPDAICPFRPLHTFHFLRPARLRTPLLGYGAPHLSARGTSTLLNNALLSAHFRGSDIRFSRRATGCGTHRCSACLRRKRPALQSLTTMRTHPT